MQIADILYACEQIAGISGFPLRVYEGNTCVKEYFSQTFTVDPFKPFAQQLMAQSERVCYLITPFNQYYGCVRHESLAIVFGPIGYEQYSLQQQQDYAAALGIRLQEFQKVYGAMLSVPSMPLENFLHLILLLNLYFNGEKLQLEDISPYLQNDILEEATPLSNTTLPFTVGGDSEDHAAGSHNTLKYERQLLSFVREGDEAGLRQFVTHAIHGEAGTLSHDQLRQQKNLFIVSTAIVSRAAIEGGMLEEDAMDISDRYIRRCEELFSVEAVLRLSLQMVTDYTHRVAALASKTPFSPLVASVITCIRQNISQPLDTQTLAGRFHVSSKTLHRRFTAEVGQSVADYVLSERIRRAESLLTQTDRPLSEIADYLGFSSQSHFQTRFKAATGQTPMQYCSNSH